MKIRTIRREKLFIPEFNGNKDLPDEEQIKVHLKSFPTVTESGKYKTYRASDEGMIEISYPNDNTLLIRHVGKIEGIEVEAGTPRIFDGTTLANTEILGLENLVAEIRKYLLKSTEELAEGEN